LSGLAVPYRWRRLRVLGTGERTPIRAGQSAGLRVRFLRGRAAILLRMRIRAKPLGRDANPLGALIAPFLPRKLKDAVDADPGNAGFSVGQPTLLSGDETPELTAFPEIDGVVPFIAVFPGFPGFGLGKGVGLVNAAVEGFAPVFGQGFQDGRGAVVMGKGLPVGAVPGDAPGLSILIPPPQKRLATGLRKAGQAKA